jgi:hypothetical protein
VTMTKASLDRNDKRIGSNNSIDSYSDSSDDGGCENKAIGPDDVLCGRGGLTNSHIGNKRFRYLVAEYQHQYLNAKKKEKKMISNRIVERVRENGGRFLKRSADSGIWAEVTPTKATEKTSQALREGLDVKHKTIRPDKILRRDSDSSQDPSLRKRARLVEGMVMESPRIFGMSGGDVPDLSDESPQFHAGYSSYPLIQSPDIAEEDCDRVEQI